MTLGDTAMATRDGSGAMFDRIASRYDVINLVASLGLDSAWRRVAAESLALEDSSGDRPRVLDIASGTGDMAIAIARSHPSVVVVGVDASPAMTAFGCDKVERAGLAARVRLGGGDAQELRFPDGSFDGAAIAFGIRNVPDRARALREMARVTKPGGRVAVLELGQPDRGLLGWLAGIHLRHVVPTIGGLVGRAAEYRYLRRSIQAFPPAAEFVRMMSGAGLEPLETRSLTFGACNLFLARAEGRQEAGAAGVVDR